MLVPAGFPAELFAQFEDVLKNLDGVRFYVSRPMKQLFNVQWEYRTYFGYFPFFIMALIQTNRVGNASVTAAVCRDSDLARFMNNAMATYIHDMDGLSKSILDQVVAQYQKEQFHFRLLVKYKRV